MIYQLIPTSSAGDPYYTQTTNFDGTDFLLAFRFNTRESAWYLSIYTPAGVLLLAGIKIVCNWSILGDFRSTEGLPPGDLIAVPNGGDDSPPGLTELGEGLRVELYYAPRG